MNKLLVVSVLGAIALSTNVSAGIYADDLGRCLVSKSSVADKTIFIQWLFDAIAANPGVRAAKVSDSEIERDNKNMASLVDRLITVDCRRQTVDVIKNEGVSGFISSFQIFGQVAASNLMNNPKVDEDLGRYAKYMDQDRMKALAAEAGVAPEKIIGKQ